MYCTTRSKHYMDLWSHSLNLGHSTERVVNAAIVTQSQLDQCTQRFQWSVRIRHLATMIHHTTINKSHLTCHTRLRMSTAILRMVMHHATRSQHDQHRQSLPPEKLIPPMRIKANIICPLNSPAAFKTMDNFQSQVVAHAMDVNIVMTQHGADHARPLEIPVLRKFGLNTIEVQSQTRYDIGR